LLFQHEQDIWKYIVRQVARKKKKNTLNIELVVKPRVLLIPSPYQPYWNYCELE